MSNPSRKRIHFVCTGNVFRSRLAEAYCNQYIKEKELHFNISSSGVLASGGIHGPIAWYTSRILFHENLVKYMKTSWDQTTAKMLESADLIVFMEEYHLKWCRENLKYNKENYEIWNIADTLGTESAPAFTVDMPNLSEQQKVDLGVMQRTEETFGTLKQKCEALLPEQFTTS